MKRVLIASVLLLPGIFLACQAEGNPTLDGVRLEAGEPSASGVESSTSTGIEVFVKPTPTNFLIDGKEAFLIEGAPTSGLDDEGFAGNAFPPMLPSNSYHENAWLRNDCQLCHEDGLKGAPPIEHRGMSRLLLEVSCRSCHVAADPDAGPLTNLAGEPIVEFLVDAFPPTLPVDESHSMGWLRRDCLQCHRHGLQDAPKVRHYGMSELLLEVNCRSCHVPGANSAQTDVR